MIEHKGFNVWEVGLGDLFIAATSIEDAIEIAEGEFYEKEDVCTECCDLLSTKFKLVDPDLPGEMNLKELIDNFLSIGAKFPCVVASSE